MTSDEQARDELLRKLTAAIGEVAASRLMQSLPPDDWSDLARQKDVGALRSDIGALRTDVNDLRSNVNDLRTDVNDLRTDVNDLRTDVNDLRGNLTRVEHLVETTKLELLAAFHEGIGNALVANTRMTIFTMAGSLVGLAGLAMGLSRLS